MLRNPILVRSRSFILQQPQQPLIYMAVKRSITLNYDWMITSHTQNSLSLSLYLFLKGKEYILLRTQSEKGVIGSLAYEHRLGGMLTSTWRTSLRFSALQLSPGCLRVLCVDTSLRHVCVGCVWAHSFLPCFPLWLWALCCILFICIKSVWCDSYRWHLRVLLKWRFW